MFFPLKNSTFSGVPLFIRITVQLSYSFVFYLCPLFSVFCYTVLYALSSKVNIKIALLVIFLIFYLYEICILNYIF